MISRFFARGLVLGVFVLLMYQISDITPQLKSTSQILKDKSNTLTIIPVTITASRRDYPSVIENRGKGFIYNNKLYTARHVISDTGYNYFIDGSVPLVSLYNLSGDLGLANYSGTAKNTGKFSYTSGLSNNQILMGQHRNNNWKWLTGTIVSSGNKGFIINLPVMPGDSGGPVIFSDQTLGVVSQSHNGNQAIIQKIPTG